MGIGHRFYSSHLTKTFYSIFMSWILPCYLLHNFLANFFVKVSPCPFFFRSHLLRLLLTLLVDSLGWAEWAWPVKHMSTRWCYQYFQGFPLSLFPGKTNQGNDLKGFKPGRSKGLLRPRSFAIWGKLQIFLKTTTNDLIYTLTLENLFLLWSISLPYQWLYSQVSNGLDWKMM